MKYVYKSVGKKFRIDWKKVKEKDEELDPVTETNKISSETYLLKLSRELKIKDVNSLKKEWIDAFRRAAVLNAKVVRIIKQANRAGYKVAALSNTITLHEKIHIEKGHYKLFDVVFLSTRLGIRKPHLKIYRYTAKRLRVKPSECVFIDDKRVNVTGARKVGMKAVLFKNAAQLEKELKKYL